MRIDFPTIKITNAKNVRVSDVLTLIFVFACVLLPADMYNIKIGSILFMFIVSLVDKSFSRFDECDNRIVCYGFVLPMYYLLVSLRFSDSGVVEIVKAVYPGFMLIICFFTRKRQQSFKKWLLAALKIEAVLIVFMVITDMLHVWDIETSPLFWFHNSGNAMMGKGSQFFTYYMVFFKTSPLLFVLLFDSLKNSRAVWTILSFAAIIFSGTRANVFMCVVCLLLYAIFFQSDKNKRYTSLIICLAIAFIGFKPISSYVVKVFTNKASSDAIRSGHIQGLLNLWAQDPKALLLGSGFCSSFYSLGRNDYVSTIEQAYWDLIFKVGVVGFIPFLCMLIAPLKNLIKKGAYEVLIPYLAFLVITYTNPFLYSSTGYLLLIFVYGCAFEKSPSVYGNVKCGEFIEKKTCLSR